MPNIIKSGEVAHKTPFLIQNHKAAAPMPHMTAVKDKAQPGAVVEAEQVLIETKKLAEQILHQARTDAGLVLQKAAQEAETIKERAQAEGYAKGHEQGENHGHEEGYRAGYQQGLEEGTAAVRQEMANTIGQSVRQAEKLLVQAEKERSSIVLSADRLIIDLALAVAGKIIAREVEENPLVILPIVKEALEKVRDQAQLVVRINPAHYPLLLEARSDLQRMIGGQQSITILSDQSLGEADCVLETGNGTVDAHLDTQMTLLRRRLEELVAHA